MIVLVTGPFGVGKTSAARELVGRLPNALLFDPEEIGAFLRRLFGPLAPAEDYQDLPLWRELTVDLAARVHAEHGRNLVVPVAIRRRDYLAELTDGWRARGIPVAAFRLVASRATLTARILARPDAEGPHAWCLTHLEAGLAAAHDPAFGTPIPTDGRTPAEVADAVLRACRP